MTPQISESACDRPEVVTQKSLDQGDPGLVLRQVKLTAGRDLGQGPDRQTLERIGAQTVTAVEAAARGLCDQAQVGQHGQTSAHLGGDIRSRQDDLGMLAQLFHVGGHFQRLAWSRRNAGLTHGQSVQQHQQGCARRPLALAQPGGPTSFDVRPRHIQSASGVEMRPAN